jgi:hypothetical protein
MCSVAPGQIILTQIRDPGTAQSEFLHVPEKKRGRQTLDARDDRKGNVKTQKYVLDTLPS